jgi:hypothetical protein
VNRVGVKVGMEVKVGTSVGAQVYFGGKDSQHGVPIEFPCLI